MKNKLSDRLSQIVTALPLFDGAKVLEIGCGSGAAARAIAHRIGNGHIVAIDRSAKAIQQAITASGSEIATGRLSFKQTAIEYFELEEGEEPFDIVFAVRVGALDGRYPELEPLALEHIKAVLAPQGKFYTDRGNPAIFTAYTKLQITKPL